MVLPAHSESVLVLALYQKAKDITLLPLVRADRKIETNWRLPGGGVKRQEFPQQAATRELQEEVGLTLESAYQIAAIKKRGTRHSREHWQYFYAGEIFTTLGFLHGTVDGEENLTNKLFLLSDVKEACINNQPLDGFQILPPHKQLMLSAFERIFS